jgi:hypothetical protein
MKLFDYETYEDYGWEVFFQVLTIPEKFALLDITIQLDDYGLDEILPAIQLSIGSSHLFGLYFRWKRFQFDCGIIDWKPRDLMWYRRNKDAVLP